jgi:hypothetical protein
LERDDETSSFVMAALEAAIQAVAKTFQEIGCWMAGSGPAMTNLGI